MRSKGKGLRLELASIAFSVATTASVRVVEVRARGRLGFVFVGVRVKVLGRTCAAGFVRGVHQGNLRSSASVQRTHAIVAHQQIVQTRELFRSV